MEHLGEFRLIFTGALAEAVPFLALAALATFLIELLAPDDFFRRVFSGRGAAGGVFIAAAAGFVLPVSECCVVPLARRLHDRGVPLAAAMTLMMAAPSLNLLVLAGTAAAFPREPGMVFWRVGLGFALVVTMGLVLAFLTKDEGAAVQPAWAAEGKPPLSERARRAADSAVDDFLLMLALLVAASAIAAGVQAFAPHHLVHAVETNGVVGAPAMMLFSFVTSTASESDAFVAASFAHISSIPRLAFLLLGPVIDLKLALAHFALLPRRAALCLLAVFPLLVVLALFLKDRV